MENLLCIVTEHLLSIEPQLVAAIPPPAKRVENMIELIRDQGVLSLPLTKPSYQESDADAQLHILRNERSPKL